MRTAKTRSKARTSGTAPSPATPTAMGGLAPRGLAAALRAKAEAKAKAEANASSAANPPANLTRQASSHTTLRGLGLIGLESIEPVILAALATETPLLLIGPHGTAKSLLLSRLCEALELPWRHYNASLVNYDDLIGYPLPDAQGHLKFIQTPASVWGAAAVFIDEISRARPDMLNRLFPIIHERKVQGLDLVDLRFRWAAMNPPVSPDRPDQTAYTGSEPLDAALADRFGFVVSVPAWSAMSEQDQTRVITSQIGAVPADAAAAVRDAVTHIQGRLPAIEQGLGEAFAEYVRCISQHTARLQLPLSGRRAAMLYRNLLAVHAAFDRVRPGTRPEDSSWLALSTGLPQVASGATIDSGRLLLAHNEVWRTLRLDRGDPRRLLSAEPDAVRRLLMALNFPQVTMQEISGYAADALARLGPGGRHALALHLMETQAASRLITAVAEQVAELFAEVSAAQNINNLVSSGSASFAAWQEVVRVLATIPTKDADRGLIENLLASQWSKRTIARKEDVATVLEAWQQVRTACGGGNHVKQP